MLVQILSGIHNLTTMLYGIYISAFFLGVKQNRRNIGSMFSFQGSLCCVCSQLCCLCLSLYPGDLYIIPRGQGNVNTFFTTFLRFFRETLGFVDK